MSFGESLLVALFCMSFVFLVLAALAGIIKVFSLAVGQIGAKQPATETLRERALPGPSGGAVFGGELRLRNVDEPTAAMIMAIVSDQSGIPLEELCFRSIRLVEKSEEGVQ